MTATDVITSFFQQGESDCTTIATIKTAIAAYGINNVFAAQADGNGNWNVSLKDGSQLVVPDAQINALKPNSGFTLVQPPASTDAQAIYDYALFCFGVFVANYARLNNVSIDVASQTIDKGINVFQDKNTPYSSYRYLGVGDDGVTDLTDDNRITDPSGLAVNPVYLLCNTYHAVLAAADKYDEYGTPTSTSDFVRNHRKWFSGKTMWAYKFL